MKILELRFKNLNSLYGEWVIDFTDPEYVSNGIFALTGQTGECYAEVLFESRAGRFRCQWEQHRARKKAEGNLQDQEHQIADADTGKPIETKKSPVGAVIEEKTGMDFDRFTRSILLAQGGFDTFLKADVVQKSKILEQITGTEIYSEISRRVHECQRDEREKLHGLIGSADGKKYRNFAQGLSFELMVSHASRKVRVDPLFLDEGFGTLDEEALETALDTLAGLQQDGKLIGIISHVSAIKERISTQINITPVSGGRSSLSGPGCTKVVKKEELEK